MKRPRKTRAQQIVDANARRGYENIQKIAAQLRAKEPTR